MLPRARQLLTQINIICITVNGEECEMYKICQFQPESITASGIHNYRGAPTPTALLGFLSLETVLFYQAAEIRNPEEIAGKVWKLWGVPQQTFRCSGLLLSYQCWKSDFQVLRFKLESMDNPQYFSLQKLMYCKP